MSLGDGFGLWGVRTGRASEKLLQHLKQHFPAWGALEEFASAVPVQREQLCRNSQYIAILDESETILEILEESPKTVFIPIGILADGSLLGIDTESKMGLEVGRFWFEECSESEWSDLTRQHYHPFSLSYEAYLVCLHTLADDDMLEKFLV